MTIYAHEPNLRTSYSELEELHGDFINRQGEHVSSIVTQRQWIIERQEG